MTYHSDKWQYFAKNNYVISELRSENVKKNHDNCDK